MAADNSAYDYFLQNNPHKPENNKPVSNAEKRIPAEEPETVRVPNIAMKVTPPKRGSASKVFIAALSALLVFFCVIYGSVYASDSSEGMVIIPKYIDQNDDVSGEDQYTISASSFSGAKILKYSENGGKTEIVDATSDKEAIMDGIAEDNEGLNPAKVLIYMSEGRVKLLAVTEGY